MEGIAVSVREAEIRAQQGLAVGALIDTHVLTEALAQEAPERPNVKSHRGSVASSGGGAVIPLILKSKIKHLKACRCRA